MIGTPGRRGPGRRTRAPRRGDRWSARRSIGLRRVHRRAATDRDDDRVRPGRSRGGVAAPRSTVEAPGFGSTSAKMPVAMPCAARGRRGSGSTIPTASHARIGHDEGAGAAGRGDASRESLDRPDPEQDPVAQRSSRTTDRRACAISDLDARRRCWCRAGPSASAGSRAAWNQRSVVDAVGVVEDPDLVEVALVRVGDRVRASAGARHRT